LPAGEADALEAAGCVAGAVSSAKPDEAVASASVNVIDHPRQWDGIRNPSPNSSPIPIHQVEPAVPVPPLTYMSIVSVETRGKEHVTFSRDFLCRSVPSVKRGRPCASDYTLLDLADCLPACTLGRRCFAVGIAVILPLEVIVARAAAVAVATCAGGAVDSAVRDLATSYRPDLLGNGRQRQGGQPSPDFRITAELAALYLLKFPKYGEMPPAPEYGLP
jgi:hypothetical protein